MMNYDLLFMREALKEARAAFEHDEVPVGAVITRDNHIVARAHNQVELLKDPTAHAEILAITQAASSLKSKWLLGCKMYVTLEPCCMCAGALVLARMKAVLFGAADPKTGACESVFQIVSHPALNHRVEVGTGLLSEECGALLSEFFLAKRTSCNGK
ncbi:MAG: tRNA adenosine(34) deaminase TadA [Candidatus Omnitrophota bacterium]|jgi:tRNA(adenine34) deaminase